LPTRSRCDLPLEAARPLLDPRHAGVDVRRQEEHEIGHRDLRLQRHVELVVDREVVVAQRQVGEDPVLLEGVVGDDQPLEELLLDDVLLLLVARQQEIGLRLEGGARPVLVELGEEGVLDVLEDLDRLEPADQTVHQ